MQHHTTNAPRVVAISCSTLLVVASAGFGAVFAYRIGIHGGILLAGLTITFAISLELLKPLAISAAFDAFRNWSLVRGLALALLGLFAVAYSLTSELALMASNRGDQTAERQAKVFGELAARERYQRAKDELAILPLKPSKAERRRELEAIMSQSSERVTQPGNNVIQADPGAASLTVYLGALGVIASVETVATWLNLVPVLAMELGSTLAGILVSSFKSEPRVRIRELPDPLRTVQPRDMAAQKLLTHLKDNGGKAAGSHRSLGKLLGLDKSTLGRAMGSLAGAGLIVLEASKQGSVLRLVS